VKLVLLRLLLVVLLRALLPLRASHGRLRAAHEQVVDGEVQKLDEVAHHAEGEEARASHQRDPLVLCSEKSEDRYDGSVEDDRRRGGNVEPWA